MVRDHYGQCLPKIGRLKRTFRFSLFVFIASAGLSQPALCQTLIESVQNGLMTSPAVEAGRQQLAASTERRTQANALRRATIQGEASTGLAGVSRNQQSFNGPSPVFNSQTTPTGVSVVMEQPLYTGGRYAAARSVAEIQIRQAEIRLRSVELETIQGIVTAWGDVRRDLAIIDVRKQTIQALDELLIGARERFRLGEATLTQSAQAEARLAGERSSLAVAQANLQTSQSTFERFTGLSIIAPSDEGVLPEVPASLEIALQNASGVNPALLVSRLEEDLARARAREVDAESNGRVTMRASVSADRDQGFDGSRTTNAQVQARYTIPLWSGGGAPSRQREATAQAQAARLTARDFERQTQARVSSAWGRLLASRTTLEASRQQVSAAMLALRGAKAEFLFGLGDQLNVLNNQAELSSAQIGLVENQRDSLIAHYNLLFAIGSLDGTSFSARPPTSAFEVISDPAAWEEPLIRVQQRLDPKTRQVERFRQRAVRAVLGPEE